MGHKGHFRMYEFIGADGTTQKKRLCVRVHQEQIDALKATRVATSQPGQRQITGMTQATLGLQVCALRSIAKVRLMRATHTRAPKRTLASGSGWGGA
jgi:hypothetical protein